MKSSFLQGLGKSKLVYIVALVHFKSRRFKLENEAILDC